jgi:hypothetical protein
MAMEGAGRSGIAGSANERMAMVKSLAAGIEKFPGNPVIRSVVPTTEEVTQLLIDTSSAHDEILDCLADAGIKDHVGLLIHIYKVIPAVLSDLRAQETAETIEGYKSWILDIAEEVAKAGKEGDFLGFGGEWFSAEEREIYKNLEKLLR